MWLNTELLDKYLETSELIDCSLHIQQQAAAYVYSKKSVSCTVKAACPYMLHVVVKIFEVFPSHTICLYL